MLDEIKEFEQYTANTSKIKLETCRLKYSTLIKDEDFSGIERALTTIARGYIFNYNENPVDDFNVEQERNIKEVLKAWCGLNNQKGDLAINGWLVNYLQQVLLLQKIKECEEELNSNKLLDTIQKKIASVTEEKPKQKKKDLPDSVLEKLKSLSDTDISTYSNDYLNLLKGIENNIKRGNRILKSKKDDLEKHIEDDDINSVFTQLHIDLIQICHVIDALGAVKRKTGSFDKELFPINFSDKNDYKAITLEKIVANALNMGELEKYVLACNANPWETIEENKTDTIAVRKFTGNNEGGLRLLDSHRDLVLKLTAYYLLQKRYTDQEYVVFNQTDLVNWHVGQPKSGNLGLEKYKFKPAQKQENVVRKVNEGAQSIAADYVPLFDTITVGANKENNKRGIGLTKIKLHPEWLQRFELIKLGKNSSLKAEEQNKIFLYDRGAGQILEERNNTSLPVYLENMPKEKKTNPAKKKTQTKKM